MVLERTPRTNDPGAWAVLTIVTCFAVFVPLAARCVPESSDPAWTVLWSLDGCPKAMNGFGALRLASAWDGGEWWRALTTGFVHGSVVHLALNMWSVWVLGPWAARAWGELRAFGLFIGSSLCGILASTAWAEAPTVVGASAGIFGVAGALWLARGWGTEEVRGELEPISTRGLGLTLAVMLALGFVVPVVAQAGHVGGLVFGLAGGLALGVRGPRWRLPGWGLGLALLIVVGAGAKAPKWRPAYFEFRGYAALEAGKPRRAARLLGKALDRQERTPELLNGVAYGLAEAGEQLDWATKLVDEALEAEPENPDYLDTKGWVLCRQGKARKGLVWIEKASAASGGEVAEIEEHLKTCGESAVL
ncbi:MAG: rhomboid family intramembrane serine protease [Myxococcota bacterium]